MKTISGVSEIANVYSSCERHSISIPDCETDTPLKALLQIEREEALQKVLETLSPRMQEILILRFALNGGEKVTLKELGKQFGVSQTRIRSIEAKALRMLRHPDKISILEKVFDIITVREYYPIRKRT